MAALLHDASSASGSRPWLPLGEVVAYNHIQVCLQHFVNGLEMVCFLSCCRALLPSASVMLVTN